MKYEFELVYGKVEYIYEQDGTKTINAISLEQAEEFVKKRKITQSNKYKGYPIKVDENYYFCGKINKSETKTI